MLMHSSGVGQLLDLSHWVEIGNKPTTVHYTVHYCDVYLSLYTLKIHIICYRYNTRKQQCRFKDIPGQQPVLANGQSTPTVASPTFYVTTPDGDHNMLQMSADKTHSMIQSQDYIKLKPYFTHYVTCSPYEVC